MSLIYQNNVGNTCISLSNFATSSCVDSCTQEEQRLACAPEKGSSIEINFPLLTMVEICNATQLESLDQTPCTCSATGVTMLSAAVLLAVIVPSIVVIADSVQGEFASNARKKSTQPVLDFVEDLHAHMPAGVRRYFVWETETRFGISSYIHNRKPLLGTILLAGFPAATLMTSSGAAPYDITALFMSAFVIASSHWFAQFSAYPAVYKFWGAILFSLSFGLVLHAFVVDGDDVIQKDVLWTCTSNWEARNGISWRSVLFILYIVLWHNGFINVNYLMSAILPFEKVPVDADIQDLRRVEGSSRSMKHGQDLVHYVRGKLKYDLEFSREDSDRESQRKMGMHLIREWPMINFRFYGHWRSDLLFVLSVFVVTSRTVVLVLLLWADNTRFGDDIWLSTLTGTDSKLKTTVIAICLFEVWFCFGCNRYENSYVLFGMWMSLEQRGYDVSFKLQRMSDTFSLPADLGDAANVETRFPVLSCFDRLRLHLVEAVELFTALFTNIFASYLISKKGMKILRKRVDSNIDQKATECGQDESNSHELEAGRASFFVEG